MTEPTNSAEQVAQEATREFLGAYHPSHEEERLELFKIILSAINRAIAEKDAELERERMCHAACGVIAMSNTPESLAKNREMLPEYLSGSVQDCIKAAEREILLRQQLEQARADSERLDWLGESDVQLILRGRNFDEDFDHDLRAAIDKSRQ